MRAWQVAALGEPADVMAAVEALLPEVGPGHLRVRVLATALNFPDVLMVRGHYQVRPDLPFTPGVEVCGEVLACLKQVLVVVVDVLLALARSPGTNQAFVQ